MSENGCCGNVVSNNNVAGYGGGCGVGGFGTTGAVLVLFILLVIIISAFCI
ncbi:hypothetical protein J2T13_003187 [Paenibacillus sp. DS2015]|uniref:YjcZ family sporulation protein n=1 Tax=Paenibacillus sp. DS2015 TaxID=3373917 RepID=UPI003D1FE567